MPVRESPKAAQHQTINAKSPRASGWVIPVTRPGAAPLVLDDLPHRCCIVGALCGGARLAGSPAQF